MAHPAVRGASGTRFWIERLSLMFAWVAALCRRRPVTAVTDRGHWQSEDQAQLFGWSEVEGGGWLVFDTPCSLTTDSAASTSAQPVRQDIRAGQ